MHVRELPPLRLHVQIVSPSGRTVRWGDDEPDPANIPTGLSFSSTMPGGHEQLDVTLPRKPGVDYSDLERLSTIRVRGPGGDIAWEGRLERSPRTSGDQLAISPSAVGWQAHLDDNQSASGIVIDRDLSRWTGISLTRLASLDAFQPVQDATAAADVTGAPGLLFELDGIFTGSGGVGEAWYDAGAGNNVGGLIYASPTVVLMSGGVWSFKSGVAPDNGAVPGFVTITDHGNASTIALGTRMAADAMRYAWLSDFFPSTSASDIRRYRTVTNIAVLGDHGLTIRGDSGAEGFLASDIVTYLVGRWAPLLRIDDSVQASSFVVEDFKFYDPTTAGEMIRQATSYGLQDWAVWDNRTFYWAERGTYGRKWRARIAPAQLSETGPQLDRLWESVIVSYQDVDGSTRTVGPPGSGADTEDVSLKDTDPENPANQLGITRRSLLQMGVVSTAAGATATGYRFLQEQKLLDSSGQAQLVGHVMDDCGVLHPYWRVRAGDQISFVDASDTSERRIVKASHDHGTRTCTVDLDAPPEGLAELLARLGVVLVPLGIAN